MLAKLIYRLKEHTPALILNANVIRVTEAIGVVYVVYRILGKFMGAIEHRDAKYRHT